jgi:hypothetical protein
LVPIVHPKIEKPQKESKNRFNYISICFSLLFTISDKTEQNATKVGWEDNVEPLSVKRSINYLQLGILEFEKSSKGKSK